MCCEPRSFAINAEMEPGKQEVITTKLARQTYTLSFIEGPLASPIAFQAEHGPDHAPTMAQLPDGECVPFQIIVKGLVAKYHDGEFKLDSTWGGDVEVPSYHTGGFLDPRAAARTRATNRP